MLEQNRIKIIIRMVALNMSDFYKITDIVLKMDYVPHWTNSRFICTKFVGNTDIEIIYLKKTASLYNLEKYCIPKNFCCCFRNEEDVFFTNDNWTLIGFLFIQNYERLVECLQKIFYTHAVHHHILQLHSSLISVNDRGLMFLGPSGIGKTTQAELWNKYRDALIINGDVVFVQETENAFLGWGTPWHGSSPYCENTSVPVHAMIVLKQAQENSIRELSGFEKVTAVSNSVFYPQWLENGMELCLETLDHLLSSVPVYELFCRPDEDAVRITEEAVFGGRL